MLVVQNLYSGYQHVPVLKDVSFELKSGEITGLIGLNGAGKSTLLKTILGLIHPQEGQILLKGLSIQANHQAYSQEIAYIPETPILYEGLTLREHLEMTGLGYGIDKEEVMRRAQPLLQIFRLDKYLSWFPSHFSKGMKQKLMIISALITEASLYIIDEPFLGLDPLAIRDFTNLLRERANQGSTILFTTHVLSIAPSLCDNYLLLQDGKLVNQGDLDRLRENYKMPDASLESIYLKMTEEASQ